MLFTYAQTPPTECNLMINVIFHGFLATVLPSLDTPVLVNRDKAEPIEG